MTNETSVGKTKDQGWEMGVRRTFPISSERAWELLVTQPGIQCWLGDVEDIRLEKDAALKSSGGTAIRITSYTEGGVIRMKWRLYDWDFDSTLQVRVIPAGDKATIAFHQDNLQSGQQREQMLAHWNAVMDNLEKLIGQN